MTWPNYSAACRKDVDELLKRGGSLSAYRANKDYGAGPAKDSWAWRLERDIEKRFKVKHAVACNSGTAALHAGLHSLDLGRGDEVITSPYTFSATAAAILHAGGIPVFADVDPYTFCITKETVKRALTRRTRAILPVHLFGGLAGVQSLQTLGLPIIEDACQSVGARLGERFSGSFGMAGAYSFNGGKNVPAGEAGALVTNNGRIAERARYLANHGENFRQYWVGYNYRPNEVTCCIAWHGLQELEERNSKRQSLYYRLANLTEDRRTTGERLHFPYGGPRDGHVFYVVPFLIDRGRDSFIKRMKERGIACSGGYVTPPIHHYKAFRKYTKRELPVVDELSFKTLCLLGDLTPDKPLSYADRVAEAIRESLA